MAWGQPAAFYFVDGECTVSHQAHLSGFVEGKSTVPSQLPGKPLHVLFVRLSVSLNFCKRLFESRG